MPEVIYLITRKGTVHRGARLGSRVSTLEEDNLDQANTTAYAASEREQVMRLAKRYCKRCMPDGLEPEAQSGAVEGEAE